MSLYLPSSTPLIPPTGAAYSFFTSANGKMAKQLVSILEEAGQAVPPEMRQFALMGGGGGGGECSVCSSLGEGRGERAGGWCAPEMRQVAVVGSWQRWGGVQAVVPALPSCLLLSWTCCNPFCVPQSGSSS